MKEPPGHPPPTAAIPVWPLAMLVAVLPVLATHAALWLSVTAGHVPDCVPYLEGCTSISRAARHGLGNPLFRLLMVPTAALTGICWMLAPGWLRLHHPDARAGRSLPALGFVCALALAVYATFLGSEGDVYRWLRRHGVIWYFACNYLAQLVFVHRSLQSGQSGRSRTARAMLVLCVAMLAIGLANVASTALLDEEGLKDRIENALEWNLALLSTLWFVLLAALWKRRRYALLPRAG